MKTLLFTLLLGCCTLVQAQNVKVTYSLKEYHIDSMPAGVPMFTYPLTVLSNSDVLSVASYEKKYLKYVYLNSEGKELYAGKVDFVKFPKYSAYIYKFLVHGTLITAYSIVQEKVDGKDADVLYRYVIDMSTNKLVSEEVVSTRSLAENKLGTLTVFPDENNQSATIFKCTHPEKNKFVFNLTVLDPKNETLMQKEIDYVNDELKGMTMSIQAVRYVANDWIVCSLQASNKDLNKSVIVTIVVNLKQKKVSIMPLNTETYVRSYGIISYYPGQPFLNLNYVVVTDKKTSFLTETTKSYYDFFVVPFNISNGSFGQAYTLPITKITQWMTEKTKQKDISRQHIFPVNFLMTPGGDEAVLMSNSFDGVQYGDEMAPGMYYYKDPYINFWHPKAIGTFMIDAKGTEKNACYGKDFEYESSGMFDLASSKNGYYILNQSADETLADKTKAPHYFTVTHLDNDGKTTTTTLSHNPNNTVENIYYQHRGSPSRNPAGYDGYNTHYKTNASRNVFCYMLKSKTGKTYRYVWLSCE